MKIIRNTVQTYQLEDQKTYVFHYKENKFFEANPKVWTQTKGGSLLLCQS